MKNLSRHRDLLRELEASLLIRGIQMGEMYECWLIGLIKHAIWVDGQSKKNQQF
jgi:hypothetical protein